MGRRAIVGAGAGAAVVIGVLLWTRLQREGGDEPPPADLPRGDVAAPAVGRKAGEPQAAAIDDAPGDAGVKWAEGQDPRLPTPLDDDAIPGDKTEHADPAAARRARVEELLVTLSAKADAAEKEGKPGLAEGYRKRAHLLRAQLTEAP